MFIEKSMNFMTMTTFLQITLHLQCSPSYNPEDFIFCINLQTDLKVI